jgi:hypothetical protein
MQIGGKSEIKKTEYGQKFHFQTFREQDFHVASIFTKTRYDQRGHGN